MNCAIEDERSIPYDELAAHYRSVSAIRTAYLRAVDEIIIRRIAGNADSSWMSGPPTTANERCALQKSAHIPNVVLVEPSAGTRKLCRQNTPAEIWPLRAEEAGRGPPNRRSSKVDQKGPVKLARRRREELQDFSGAPERSSNLPRG